MIVSRSLRYPLQIPLLCIAVLLAMALPRWLYAQSISPEAAASCRAKYNLLRSGPAGGSGALNFSEQEINSWLELELSASYPDGVKDVSAELQRDHAVVLANVNFDLLKLSMPNLFPDLLEYLLTGTHDVRVEGTIRGEQGRAEYDITSVTLDNVPLPSFAVEMILKRVLQRRFPGKNVDSPFPLPYGLRSLSLQPGRIEVYR